MPGFELTRFPELSALLKDMTCTICKQILYNPMVTKCCQSTFCESCIKAWINSKRACPVDRKPLKVADGLHNAPTAITKILNRQKIKCAMANKGCLEILSLKNIESHEKSCSFGKKLCDICSFEVGKDLAQHKCLNSVMDYKANVSKELEEASNHIRSYRVQIENCIKTIRDLTSERTKAADAAAMAAAQAANTKPEMSKRVSNNKDLLLEARKFLNSPWMDAHKTQKEIAEKVLDVVKEALTSKGEKIFDVTKAIKEAMDCHTMGDWNVYFLWNNIGYVFHNVSPEGFIEIKFGKVSVTVYKSFDSFGFNRLVSLYRAGAIRDFVVSKTGFDENATHEIEKVALEALKKSNDSLEFTDKVTAELMNNYGGSWHCFIHKGNFGFYSVRSDKGQFCLLSNAECKILIFQ